MKLDQKTALALVDETCKKQFGCPITDATKQQAYKSLCLVIKDILVEKNLEFSKSVKDKESKQVYYMSMEFLVGTSLRNNLSNLKVEKQFASALAKVGIDISELYEMEPDAGLGNGGLGRLASCYMDSLSSLGIPATGYSIRYEFGIFKQRIVDGWQMEFPDDWLNMGDVWLTARTDESVEVKFGGRVDERFDENGYHAEHVDYSSIVAVPYDMYISGYDSKAVNKLVLWSAKSPRSLDMTAFSRGDYAKALEENTKAEVISKILYPADDHMDGKILRIKQQYFFVSASLQTIVKKHYKKYSTLDNLADKVSVHINDTHPALCVPELMRIMMDEYGYGWDDAWAITQKTLSYTNHTVMSEALERWSETMFREQLPRIYQIVAEINRRLLQTLHEIYPGDFAKIDYMAVIANGEVRMANLCLACCHTINGVSKLHSNILTESIFRDYYNIDNSKFTNVTNGIAYRRWLMQANPELTSYIEELIGPKFKKDSKHLENLLQFEGNKEVIDRLFEIKRNNKIRLAEYISSANGVNVDPDSIFDIQIKRLHEYKRQLLNVLQILYMYNKIKENPNLDIPPRTFVFAAKASSGYFMAKQIIRLIVAVSNTINNDPVAREKIKVVFIEDYRVSLAEIIIPAADISEQISIAGKEASGTGNMKLMINGAVTLGTLDGANVEIFENVGEDNIFLFGLKSHEVDELWRRGYSPLDYTRSNPELQKVLDMLTSNVLGARFDDIAKSLLTNAYGTADAYMALADFDSYVKAQERVSATYIDKYKFGNMSLVNIAKSGVFSSDRAIMEYAKNIWHCK
ncbi:MAG: glycogen/starch/alpha-glucan phosphorylase [Ruminococcaceae bacterium]|nr:glycogen/starch/alpha-glucan phosphorylase [Oscillospiraceae bacterium]